MWLVATVIYKDMLSVNTITVFMSEGQTLALFNFLTTLMGV